VATPAGARPPFGPGVALPGLWVLGLGGGWWLWVGVVVGVEFAEGGVGEFGEFGWGLVFGSFEGLGGGGVVSFVVE
jgi:hypothetical protein